MKNMHYEQKCTNCKYFQRYYIINSRLVFYPTTQGFCANGKVNKSTANKLVRKDEGCHLWQPYELKQLERQLLTKELIIRIDNRLKDLAAILNDTE